MDARGFLVADTLRNGVPATFRAVRPGDEERLEKAFAGLAPSTVYTRFFGSKSALTERELTHIGEIDFVNEVMLVVTVAGDAGEVIVGSGRYVAMGAGARTAEVAFTVEEDYQGQGIASRLLGHLAGIARDNGFTSLEAFVLAGNRPMLAVFARSGLAMQQRREEDALHVVLALG
jgi:GNAT superfamily N-acetyltransferase